MADLLFVLLLGALFAITAGFVVLCDRMLGPDDDAGMPAPAANPDVPQPQELAR